MVSNIFYFHPYIPGEMISNLTNMFQMGWFNHQLVICFFYIDIYVCINVLWCQQIWHKSDINLLIFGMQLLVHLFTIGETWICNQGFPTARWKGQDPSKLDRIPKSDIEKKHAGPWKMDNTSFQIGGGFITNPSTWSGGWIPTNSSEFSPSKCRSKFQAQSLGASWDGIYRIFLEKQGQGWGLRLRVPQKNCLRRRQMGDILHRNSKWW